MKRRHVLKGLPVAGSLSLAGCSSVLDFGESGTTLGKIEVINSSFVPNRIRLIVTRDDETLADRKIGLAAIDAEDDAAWTTVEPSWSETRSSYTIHALHVDGDGNRESSSWEYTFTREDYETYYGDGHEDPGCVGAVVRIGSLTDTKNAGIGISPTYMENPCSTPDPR